MIKNKLHTFWLQVYCAYQYCALWKVGQVPQFPFCVWLILHNSLRFIPYMDVCQNFPGFPFLQDTYKQVAYTASWMFFVPLKCTPVIPVLRRAEAGGLWVQGQFGRLPSCNPFSKNSLQDLLEPTKHKRDPRPAPKLRESPLKPTQWDLCWLSMVMEY